MSGIYIHIPFCRQKCHYCDFHFSVSMKHKNPILDSLKKEFSLKKDFLEESNPSIDTIYFGGGTPSVLSADEISGLIDELDKHYHIEDVHEITLECNPDDINSDYMAKLAKTSINRLSIGIQSFNDEDLIGLNRVHSADEAINSVKIAQAAGLDNITIDLIYGLPDSTLNGWKQNLEQTALLGIEHLSAYALTIEKRTALHHFIQQGQVTIPSDDLTMQQFDYLMDWAKAKNMIHYEISNFAMKGKLAIHNTNYWKNKNYIGFGPSAHSYNGRCRTWNISNNSKYIKALYDGVIPQEKESLNTKDKYNEYVLTGLRTMWGIEGNRLKQFGQEIYEYFTTQIEVYIATEHIQISEDSWRLTRKGKYIADRISSDLFWISDV